MNPFLLNPWFLLSAGITVLGIAIGSFYEGYHYSSLSWQHKYDAITQQAEAAADAWEDKANEASVAYEQGAATSKTIYKTITQEIPHVITNNQTVYTNVCLDDAGLQLANSALTRSDPSKASTSQPRSILPTPDATPGRTGTNGITEAGGDR